MKKVLLAFATASLTALSLFAETPTLPRKAPELSYNIPGQGEQLLSQYRGKVVALEFIQTTCPHCQAASKVMTRFQQEFGSSGFQALDVAINPNADLLVGNFVKDYGVGFPVGWAPFERMVSFMGFSMADRSVVPQLALIDRKGMIRYQTPPTGDEAYEKVMQESAIREHITQLLGESSSSANATGRKAPRASRLHSPSSR